MKNAPMAAYTRDRSGVSSEKASSMTGSLLGAELIAAKAIFSSKSIAVWVVVMKTPDAGQNRGIRAVSGANMYIPLTTHLSWRLDTSFQSSLQYIVLNLCI